MNDIGSLHLLYIFSIYELVGEIGSKQVFWFHKDDVHLDVISYPLAFKERVLWVFEVVVFHLVLPSLI
jgi:hypothetical protein